MYSFLSQFAVLWGAPEAQGTTRHLRQHPELQAESLGRRKLAADCCPHRLQPLMAKAQLENPFWKTYFQNHWSVHFVRSTNFWPRTDFLFFKLCMFPYPNPQGQSRGPEHHLQFLNLTDHRNTLEHIKSTVSGDMRWHLHIYVIRKLQRRFWWSEKFGKTQPTPTTMTIEPYLHIYTCVPPTHTYTQKRSEAR